MTMKGHSTCSSPTTTSFLAGPEPCPVWVLASSSLLAHVHLVQRRAQARSQLPGIVIGPEMHEEQPGLLVQHMTVESRDFDPVLAEGLEDGSDLAGGENEVAGDGSLSAPGGLEVDGLRRPHCRRNLHPIF